MNPERWRQVEDLYHSALGCSPEERSALLAAADPELRREVELLLEQDSRANPLNRVAFNPATKSHALDVKPGSKIGPYVVESVLGQGGAGVVYRAHDTRLNRPVAIKLLSEEAADSAARRRFQREAQMASALNHPHILTVYDIGELDGRQYIVTEFVEAEPCVTGSSSSRASRRKLARC